MAPLKFQKSNTPFRHLYKKILSSQHAANFLDRFCGFPDILPFLNFPVSDYFAFTGFKNNTYLVYVYFIKRWSWGLYCRLVLAPNQLPVNRLIPFKWCQIICNHVGVRAFQRSGVWSQPVPPVFCTTYKRGN